MASSSPPESCVQLYAELLANIRQIRFYVTTKDAVRNDSRPVVTLDSSRSLVTVSHSDKTLTLKLPLSISARAREHLATSQATSHGGENEYSFRLPIDEASSAVDVTSSHDYTSMSPWPAKNMTAQTCICCRCCANILFSPREAQNIIWKDLPSADWAEMMDLWHCHKPDPIPSKDGDTDFTSLNGDTKGYGASNRVVCKPGTVFVNITSFVMTQGDCQGAKMTVRNCPLHIADFKYPNKPFVLGKKKIIIRLQLLWRDGYMAYFGYCQELYLIIGQEEGDWSFHRGPISDTIALDQQGRYPRF